MATDTVLPLSGTQFEIAHGPYRAVIASVGASLRQLTHAGRPLVVGFEADQVRPNYRGAVLAPWVNRIVDGAWTLDGLPQQVPITEPARGHALHGLATWLAFEAVAQSADAVTLAAVIEPQAGYPFRLFVQVAYTLDDDGLATVITAANLGARPAPLSLGVHPYLVAGPAPLDQWTLQLPSEQVLLVDERLSPTELGAVQTAADGAFDFLTPRVIAEVAIDNAFTGLRRDDAGLASVRISDPSGCGVVMTWGAESPWLQIHTADLPDPSVNRLGLAVEPMTAPPDAFNTGTDLIWLEPQAEFSQGCRIAAI